MTNKSPGGPPLRPGAPRPLIRMRVPSSMPAGTRTLTSRFRISTPVPRQVPQACSIIAPRPPHAEHGTENANPPWFVSATPRPPHCVQRFGEVPGRAPEPVQVLHTASLVKCKLVVRPLAASTKSMDNEASRSDPRCGPTPAPLRRPPPNICPSKSLSPPAPAMSPTSKRNAPLPDPPIAPGPRRRTSSYSRRRSSSPSTSYAAEISLKRSSAEALLGLASG